MKFVLATAAAVALATNSPSFAGGFAAPMMEPEVIAEETSNSGGFVLPLVLLALVVAVASNSGGGGGSGLSTGKVTTLGKIK